MIKEDLEKLKVERETLCHERLKIASVNKIPPWSIDDVTNVLKGLKTGKSKDPYDIPNELFKPEVAGSNLILAITKLMNRIKDELTFPSPMGVCNVTNLYKNKGSKQHFDSYRGIFRTPVLRNILDKLIYEDEYEEIDDNLTYCNVGARKRRNVRDNLFVINAMMNASKQDPKQALDVNVYDVKKCYDSLWLEETINDLYETGLRNDKLMLLYKSNLNANIAIKTSSGTTDCFNISKIVMQVWGGLQYTNSLNQLCKKVLNEEEIMYKYRGVVAVPPLEMIDDIITAVECGPKSVKLNAMVNAFIESKKLALSVEKCAKVHLGNKSLTNTCPEHKVHSESMKNSDKEKYLGDFISKSANSKETIKSRNIRGNAVLSELRAILRDIPLGKRRTQVGLILRQAWFLNGCLFNSEVWTGTNETDLKELNIIDHKILREIIGAQCKVPVEMLYLETGAIPIKSVMAVKRIIYLHNIVSISLGFQLGQSLPP